MWSQSLEFSNMTVWPLHLMVGCSPKSGRQVRACGLSCNSALLTSPPPSFPLSSLWPRALPPCMFHRIQLQKDDSRYKSNSKKELARAKLGQVWMINFFSCEVFGSSYVIISIIHSLPNNTRTCSYSSAFLTYATGTWNWAIQSEEKASPCSEIPP